MSDLVEELRDRAALIIPDNPSGLLDSAADEIDRLRGEPSWRGEPGQPGSCLFCGSHRSLHRDGNISQMDCAAKRIAELEKDRDFLAKTAAEYKADYNDRHITDAQIKAAVAYASHGTNAADRAMKWRVLGRLGFERCDEPECRGGVIQHLETPLEPGDDCGWNQKCPDCHGIGAIALQTINEKRSADDE